MGDKPRPPANVGGTTTRGVKDSIKENFNRVQSSKKQTPPKKQTPQTKPSEK